MGERGGGGVTFRREFDIKLERGGGDRVTSAQIFKKMGTKSHLLVKDEGGATSARDFKKMEGGAGKRGTSGPEFKQMREREESHIWVRI